MARLSPCRPIQRELRFEKNNPLLSDYGPLQDDGFDTDKSMRDIEFDDIKSENYLQDPDEFAGIDDQDNNDCSHTNTKQDKMKELGQRLVRERSQKTCWGSWVVPSGIPGYSLL